MISLGSPREGAAALADYDASGLRATRKDAAARRVELARAAIFSFTEGVDRGVAAVDAISDCAETAGGPCGTELIIELAVAIDAARTAFGATPDTDSRRALLLFAARLAEAERRIVTPASRPGQLRRAVFLLCRERDLGPRVFANHEFFALQALQGTPAEGDVAVIDSIRNDLVGETAPQYPRLDATFEPSHNDYSISAARALKTGQLTDAELEAFRNKRSAKKMVKMPEGQAHAIETATRLYAPPDVDRLALARALELDDFARLGSWNILGNSAFQQKPEPWRQQTASSKALNLAKLVELNRWSAFACQEVPTSNALSSTLNDAAALFKTWCFATSPFIGIGKNNTDESAFYGFDCLVWEQVGRALVFDDGVLSPTATSSPPSKGAADADATNDGNCVGGATAAAPAPRQLKRKPAVLFLRSRVHKDERGRARYLGFVSIHLDPDPDNARWEAAEFGKLARAWLSRVAGEAGVAADADVTYVIAGDFNLPQSPGLVDEETRDAWRPLQTSFLSAKNDGVATNISEFGTPPKEYDAVFVGTPDDGVIPSASVVRVDVIDISGDRRFSALAENVRAAAAVFNSILAFKDVAPGVFNFFGSFVSTREALESLLKHTGHSKIEGSTRMKKLFDDAFPAGASCRANARDSVLKLLELLWMHSLEEFKLHFSDHKPLSILLRARCVRPPQLADEFNAAAAATTGWAPI